MGQVTGDKSRLQQDFIRLADAGKLGHAYIFFGPEAGRKREFAEGLAAYFETGDWVDMPGARPLTDAQVFSAVDGTVGIDTSRAIREFLGSSPLRGRRRVAIIESAEQMTSEAENALLKIAEEPPETALLILILRDPQSLRPTLASRFQKVYFGVNEKESIAALTNDTRRAPGTALARKFLSAAPAARKNFLKELLEPEEFSLTVFLDDLIRVLAPEAVQHGSLWHAVLELRRAADTAPLNPKLQLLSLWTHI